MAKEDLRQNLFRKMTELPETENSVSLSLRERVTAERLKDRRSLSVIITMKITGTESLTGKDLQNRTETSVLTGVNAVHRVDRDLRHTVRTLLRWIRSSRDVMRDLIVTIKTVTAEETMIPTIQNAETETAIRRVHVLT
jgi:hypothetical protein